MPFREKSAWFVAIGLPVTFGVLFAAMAAGWIRSYGRQSFHYLLVATLAFVLLEVALHFMARFSAPRDAGAPADERERLIALKAARNGGLILAVGVLIVPASMHLTRVSPPQMGFLVLLALLASEFGRAVSTIVYYRNDR